MPSFTDPVFQYVVLTIWIAAGVVNIGFAAAVLSDAQGLWRYRRQKTSLVGGGLWAVGTLFSGVFVAGIYWLIHHSTLFSQQSQAASPVEPKSPKN